jgi:dipeptidyl aminopeptidase/acylaminoacyl peptidase
MSMKIRLTNVASAVLVEATLLLLGFSAWGQDAPYVTKRAITVADAVEMTRLADSGYLLTGAQKAHIAHFSPDGNKFFVVLRKGNLARNTNEFSLYVFQFASVFHLPEPAPLLTLSTSSNRDAITNVKWLADSETLVFLGEDGDQAPEIYLISTRTKRLKMLTNNPLGIAAYDITSDAHEIVYLADPPRSRQAGAAFARQDEIVIAGQDLASLLAGDYAVSEERQVFLQEGGQPPIAIPLRGSVANGDLTLSPDGHYALVGVHIRNVPAAWELYNGLIHQILSSGVPRGTVLPLTEYLVLDARDGTVGPLLNAPAVGKPIWAEDSRAVFMNTYLPLDGPGLEESTARERNSFAVEVELSSRKIRKVSEGEWPNAANPKARLEVTLEQDLNTPPMFYASDPESGRRALLLDLGVQFHELNLSRAETMEWKVKDGLRVIGGLYLPLGYQSGKRYPLVIQTHGFAPTEFSTDGAREWASAFAARPLAAEGFMVLQAFGFRSKHDHDHYNDNLEFGQSPEQAGRNINVAAIETAIDYLNAHGMIYPERVGIVGFSRTVCVVAYLLTHSRHQFAAASLVDGIDCGYFQEMAFPSIAWDVDSINGGARPIGAGLQKWLKESPGFNLDKVRTPVRLVALGPNAALEGWEWYVGLSSQGKPVDFSLLPDAAHLVVKPRERLAAQQGLVDWFCFWLKDEEDADTTRVEQYSRWREMREKYRHVATQAGPERSKSGEMN